jgi:hypothetical protein
METRRRVEFTGMELASGTKLAAPMEKAVASPRAGEGRYGAGGLVERKTGHRAWVRWRCRTAERRHNGEGGMVESTVTEAVWRSAVTTLTVR